MPQSRATGSGPEKASTDALGINLGAAGENQDRPGLNVECLAAGRFAP